MHSRSLLYALPPPTPLQTIIQQYHSHMPATASPPLGVPAAPAVPAPEVGCLDPGVGIAFLPNSPP